MSTQNYEHYFQNYLDKIKNDGCYRYFKEITRSAGKFPKAYYTDNMGNKKEITYWCSNDYLGMGQHSICQDAAIQAIQDSGVGSGGTRNICGNSAYHVQLEKLVADLYNKESALVFSSGYVSNHATLSTLSLLIPNAIIFSDEFNHASMCMGMIHGKFQKHIFKHNDTGHLKKLLASADPKAPKIIAFESIYSMEGDIAPIEDIIELSAQYNALTYLDEVHAVGLYGPEGGGKAQELGVCEHIDILEGTFAKAYGSIGGFITAQHNIIDSIRSKSPGFIFTTSLPPCSLAASYASMNYLRTSHKERETLYKNVDYLKKRLYEHKLNFLDYATHIVPIIIGNYDICRLIADVLLDEYSLYIQPINYPTVPMGTERFRMTVSTEHTQEDIDYFVTSLAKVFYQYMK